MMHAISSSSGHVEAVILWILDHCKDSNNAEWASFGGHCSLH